MNKEDKKHLDEFRDYVNGSEDWEYRPRWQQNVFLLRIIDEAHAALRFYGGTTDEGGLAFMLNTIGGFSATESKPGERARKALGEE